VREARDRKLLSSFIGLDSTPCVSGFRYAADLTSREMETYFFTRTCDDTLFY
jgi:hypothetical protein